MQYAEASFEEKLTLEEARLQRHGQSFDKRKKAAGTPPPIRDPEPDEPVGRRVMCHLRDQTGAQIGTTITVDLDKLGRVPLSFLLSEWGVTGLQLQNGIKLRLADRGFSLQGMPNDLHLEFVAFDDASGSTTDLPPPAAKPVQAAPPKVASAPPPVHAAPPKAASTPAPAPGQPVRTASGNLPMNFCPVCGAKLVPGGKFCGGCGSEVA